MKNNKGFSVMGVLIIIVVVLVIGGGAYYVGKKTNSKLENTGICGEGGIFCKQNYNKSQENQLVNNNEQKESCLIITSPLPNEEISFPLNIEGYIDLASNTCTKWGAFEGIAGSVVVKDINGNTKSLSTQMNTVGDYSIGMKKWPIKGTIKNLTGISSVNEIALFMTSDNLSGDPTLTTTKTIQPLKLISSVSECLPTTTPWVKVLSPNGGESYKIGQSTIFSWTSCNLNSNVSGWLVDVSNPNDGYALFGESEGGSLNDGKESVAFNTRIKPGTYKFLVQKFNNNITTDLSDNFFTINIKKITNLRKEGETCGEGIGNCQTGLKCAYPCGIVGCQNVCMPVDELPKP